jgi:hypothetical protein
MPKPVWTSPTDADAITLKPGERTTIRIDPGIEMPGDAQLNVVVSTDQGPTSAVLLRITPPSQTSGMPVTRR